MASANVEITQIEPIVGGKVVFLPMAPRSSNDEGGRGRLFLTFTSGTALVHASRRTCIRRAP